MKDISMIYYPELWFYRDLLEDKFDQILLEKKNLNVSEFMKNEIKEWKESDKPFQSLMEEWALIRMKTYNSPPAGEKEKEHVFANSLEEDLSSHFAMRMMCATYPQITKWFLEKETDVFWKRILSFYQDKYDPKKYIIGRKNYENVLQFIFATLFSNSINLENFNFEVHGNKKKVIVSNIKLYWELISDLMSNFESYYMSNGMISIPFEFYEQVIKYRYHKLLSDSLKKYIETFPAEIKEQYLPIVTEIFGDIESSDTFKANCNSTSDILLDSPMCINWMHNKIHLGEDLGREISLVLSFYMRAFLNLEELENYFYATDARNRCYSTLEEYLHSRKDLEYQFKSHYNSNTDYKPFGCSKCRVRGGCFFRNRTDFIIKILEQKYTEEYRSNPDFLKKNLDRIKQMVEKRRYSLACHFELSLRAHAGLNILSKWGKPFINHPFYDYYKRSNGIRLKKDPPKLEPDIKRSQNNIASRSNETESNLE